MRLSGVFYAEPGRLRAPWRLLIFFGAAAIFAIGPAFVINSVPASVERLPLWEGVTGLASALATLAATWYALRRVDRRPWSAVWLGAASAAPSRLAAGWLLGTFAIGIPVLALVAAGWLRLVPAAEGSSLGAAATALVILAPAALFEELVARGYVLSVLRDALGWVPAIALTSIAFGALHSWNPGATSASIAAVTLAGVFLAIVLMVTGSLWAATMAHLAWNWTMAALLHAPVSGLGLASPDYRLIDAGPDWATGGSWGPEGGAGAAAGMLIGAAYLYARRPRRREET